MKLQRIAYVVDVFPKLSQAFIAQELVEIERRGIDVRILSLRRPAEQMQHEFVKRSGLVDRTVYELADFRQLLRRFRPQVIHAHFATEPAAAAWELADDLNVPFTVTAHGYDVYRRPAHNFAACAAAAHAVITVSEANARHITQTFGVPRHHMRVIPCGVDTARFCPHGRRASPPQIVCAARLVPVNNLGLLLETCSLLRRRGIDFRCIVLGEGPCRAELMTVRHRLLLEDLVRFPGAADQAEVVRCWQRATVGIQTSEREGMPVSLMEAAACGVPVVATAVGGIPELVEQDVTGLLAPPGDSGALASSLEQLLGNPVLRSQMGCAARRRAVERFGLERQVDRLCGVWAAMECDPAAVSIEIQNHGASPSHVDIAT